MTNSYFAHHYFDVFPDTDIEYVCVMGASCDFAVLEHLI